MWLRILTLYRIDLIVNRHIRKSDFRFVGFDTYKLSYLCILPEWVMQFNRYPPSGGQLQGRQQSAPVSDG